MVWPAILVALIVGGLVVGNSFAGSAAAANIAAENGVKRLGPAWLSRHDGIYVLYLEGSPYDMAYQHGALLREEIQQGEMFYLSGYLHDQIRHSVIGGMPLLVKLAEDMMYAMYYDPIARQHPEEVKQALRGLSDGSGVPYRTLARVMTHSDSGQTIAGTIYKDRTIYPALQSFSGWGGCTSFIAVGAATREGHVLFGRNFDYPGAGWFDKYPVVAFCRPRSGQRYVMLTTAGLHTGGVTGLNESGLSVSWNTAITSEVSPSGIPVFSLADKILREAQSLDQARALIKAHPPSCGFIVMVSSARENNGFAAELSHNQQVFLPLQDGTLAVANSYRSPQLRERELSATWSEAVNSITRTKRIERLLRENLGIIDPQKAAQFLGDHFDLNTGRERSTGDVIGQSMNVSSVVIDSTAMNFWIATGPAPVCNTRYVGFNFENGFKGPDQFNDLPALPGVWENDPRLEGLRLFNRAEIRFAQDDPQGAIANLKSALAIAPNEPVYAQTAGLILLRTGNAEAAGEMFEQALSLPQTFHKQSIAHLGLARSLDLQGQREPALKEYQKLLAISSLNPEVKKAAQAGLKKPFTVKQAANISVVCDVGDSFSY